jgi:hypothetical protein
VSMIEIGRAGWQGGSSRVPPETGDHPGADGVVRRLVDEDERAGRAVARVVVDEQRAAWCAAHAADVVEPELGRLRSRCSVLTSRRYELLDHRAHRARRVLDRVARAAARSGSSVIQQTIASSSARRAAGCAGGRSCRRARRRGRPRAARHRHRRERLVDRAVEGVDRGDRVVAPEGSTDLVAGRSTPPATWPA